MPDSLDLGSVSEAVPIELDLLDVLQAFRVDSIARAFPESDPADTLDTAFTGEPIKIMDWSKIYKLTLPEGQDMDAFLTSLRSSPSTLLAVRNGTGEFLSSPIYPNDPNFKSGAQWPLWSAPPNGDPTEDIDAAWAWGTTTGSPLVNVGIIDGGLIGCISCDLAGRVVLTNGATADSTHAYPIAGIIGAKTNNGIGVAGVDWSARLISRIGGGGVSFDSTTSAIDVISRVQLARVINASWGLREHGNPVPDPYVKARLAEHHNRNGVTICAMGNTGTATVEYPAGYDHGVIAVGAVDQSGARWVEVATGEGSSIGSHIDVVAPGVLVPSTAANGSYPTFTGTSFAAPFVSGVASLLFAADPTLNADDVENLIRLSGDRYPAHDVGYGMGKVSASRALALLRAPNRILHGSISTTPTMGAANDINSVTVVGAAGVNVPPLPPSTYTVRRQEVYKSFNISVTPGFTGQRLVWGRGGSQLTTGYPSYTEPVKIITNLRYAEVETGCLPASSCVTMRTWVYEIPKNSGNWYPTRPDSTVTFAWTALEVAPVPDAQNSFYVPQRGTVASPIEGSSAVQLFRACPNNDGGTSLANNVRVKVVVRDAVGSGIQGIGEQDIYILLNGGSAAQGFIGDGADSVIANSQYNPQEECPSLREIHADAPTDATGTTYITFTGASDTPGEGTRDPARKWGHRDTELPVYVYNSRLQGRLTTASANGSYALQIKNYDYTMAGLGTSLNQGETVASDDFSYVANNIGLGPSQSHPNAWWADFNSNGEIDSSDFNGVSQHVTHDCNTPNDP
jgi:hypothetical protein